VNYYQAKQISVKGINLPKPVLNFEEANFPGKFNLRRSVVVNV
jgi:hypothetical protein